MSDDIEAFLRRAAQRRKAAAPPAAAPPVAEPAIPTIARPLQEQQPQPTHSSNRNNQRPQQASTPRPDSTPRSTAPVQRSVRGIRTIANPESVLGAAGSDYNPANVAVDQADERMEAHLQQAFQHQVGRLSNASANVALLENGEVTANTLLNLLQQAGGMQTALILKEILDRPTHRWQSPKP